MIQTIYKNNKILITGGGGYLGSYLAKNLCKFTCEIFLIDIKFNDISTNLDKEYSNIHLKLIDLNDKLLLNEVCELIKPDYIYHFQNTYQLFPKQYQSSYYLYIISYFYLNDIIT